MIFTRNAKMDRLIEFVCDYMYEDKKDIMSGSRKREFVVCRQIIMGLAHELKILSLTNIGKHLGGRDHSTVIFGVKSVSYMCESDHLFKVRYDEIKMCVVAELNLKENTQVSEDFYSELIYCQSWEEWGSKQKFFKTPSLKFQ